MYSYYFYFEILTPFHIFAYEVYLMDVTCGYDLFTGSQTVSKDQIAIAKPTFTVSSLLSSSH